MSHRKKYKESVTPPEADAKQVSVIEEGPHSIVAKRYLLLSEEQRCELRGMNPTLIVRLATEDEFDSLQGKSWQQLEAEELEYMQNLGSEQ